MRVYAVIHYEDEGSRVRGLFRTEAAATSQMTLTEASPRGPADEPHRAGGYWFARHDQTCCEVVAMDILEAPELPYHGPEVPYRVTYPDAKPGLIPSFVGDAIFEVITKRSRIFDDHGYLTHKWREPTNHSAYDWTKPLESEKL